MITLRRFSNSGTENTKRTIKEAEKGKCPRKKGTSSFPIGLAQKRQVKNLQHSGNYINDV